MASDQEENHKGPTRDSGLSNVHSAPQAILVPLQLLAPPWRTCLAKMGL